MPANKDLKRLTRARMSKTGEAYTTARARLLEKKQTRAAEPTPDYAALAGMSPHSLSPLEVGEGRPLPGRPTTRAATRFGRASRRC